MNSTAKGDKFEAKAFALLKQAVIGGQFFASPSQCKFFKKKGYYSKDRGSDIIFDISIEIYRPGSTAYALLVLVECKDYSSKRVPVDDAEEFYSKIEQVSDTGIKGYIVSTGAFSQGVLEYCKSKRLGLLRCYDKSTLKWELDRSPSSICCSTPDWVDVRAGLLDQSHRSRYFDFYCYSGNVYTYSLYTFLKNLICESAEDYSIFTPVGALARVQPPLVEHVSPERIESICDTMREKIRYSRGPVSLDEICKWQSEEAGLRLTAKNASSTGDSGSHVLGRINFEPLEITIFDYSGDYRGRRRFTLAHELGHHFLEHSRYMTGEYCEENDFERDGPVGLGIEDIHRLEWQANYFASCLLLPRNQFIADFLNLARNFDLEDRGHGILFVDEQHCNQRNFYAITDDLRLRYDVSRSAVRIRLQRFRLLNDARAGSSGPQLWGSRT